MIQFIEDKEFFHTYGQAKGFYPTDFEEFTFQGLIYKPNYDENFDTHCTKGTREDYDTYEKITDIFSDDQVRTVCSAINKREREIKSAKKTLNFKKDSFKLSFYLDEIIEEVEDKLGDTYILLSFYATMKDYDIDDDDIMYDHAHVNNDIYLPIDYPYEEIIDWVLKLEHLSLDHYKVCKIEKLKEVGNDVVLDRRKKILQVNAG
jgi:hypothetical protein